MATCIHITIRYWRTFSQHLARPNIQSGPDFFVVETGGIVALALLLLIIVEKRSNFPVIQFNLFRNRVFSSGVTSQFLGQMAHGGWNFLAPFLLITGMDYSASISGLIVLPFHTIRLVLPSISGALSDKFGTRPASFLGHLTLLMGLVMITKLGTDSPIWQYIVIITIGGPAYRFSCLPTTAPSWNQCHGTH
jgi:DHA2 family multidrug resistance protein